MTLQELGNLGELVAAIATVITLLYLAAQIRQSTEVVRSSQSQEFVRWRTELLQPLVGDRAMTALWMEGGENFAELDPIDQRRLIFFEWRAISGWNHYYHMRQKKLIDDHQWSELTFLFERVGRRQSMRAAWEEFRDGYDGAFRTLIDRHLT